MPRNETKLDGIDSAFFVIENEKISDLNYRALAVAVVQRTCIDYMSAWKATMAPCVREVTKINSLKTIVEAENFFRTSLWLYLNDNTIDPELFIGRLRDICNDPQKVSEISKRTIPFS